MLLTSDDVIEHSDFRDAAGVVAGPEPWFSKHPDQTIAQDPPIEAFDPFERLCLAQRALPATECASSQFPRTPPSGATR